MNGPLLVAAAVLLGFMSLVHSLAGEVLILRHLPAAKNLPVLRGSDAFYRRSLRTSWHTLTPLGLGLAALLFRLSAVAAPSGSERFVVHGIAAALAVCAVAWLVGTRARHPGWLGFGAAAVLCGLGAA